jgi:hypothetical protein
MDLANAARALGERNPNQNAEEIQQRQRNTLDPVIPPPNVVAGLANRVLAVDPLRLHRALASARQRNEGRLEITPNVRPNTNFNEANPDIEMPHVPPAVEQQRNVVEEQQTSSNRRRNSQTQAENVFERLYNDGQRRMHSDPRTRSRSVENRDRSGESRPSRNQMNRIHERVSSS